MAFWLPCSGWSDHRVRSRRRDQLVIGDSDHRPSTPDTAAIYAAMLDLGHGDVVMLADGTALSRVHIREKCADHFCMLHRPSPHRPRDAPIAYSAGVGLRVCEHRGRHPDPDDRVYRLGSTRYVGWTDRAGDAVHEYCEQRCCEEVDDE